MNPIETAEARWRITLKRNVRGEYVGPCPWCGGTDRFHVWEAKGNYWCRQCDAKGFVDDDDDLTPEEKRLRAIEAEQHRQARQLEEQSRRLTALEQMARCMDWKLYHDTMNEQQREYWFREGIFDEAIDRFRLGYCQRCPTDRDARPSYTIPVWHNGVLRNIRHRLVGAQNGDKYRPHRAGLGAMLFNVDDLAQSKRVILWEGEKKTIVMAQYVQDWANIGIMGKSAFKSEWVQWFSGARDVVIALDPDAIEGAYKLGEGLRRAGLHNVRVAAFPCKPDDMVNLYGANLGDVDNILRLARSV